MKKLVKSISFQSGLFLMLLSSAALASAIDNRHLAINKICKSSPEMYFEVGASYAEVLKALGQPKNKLEYEASRKDIWIYSGAAVEFREGRFVRVQCQKPVKSEQVDRSKVLNVERATVPESHQGFSEALSELTRVSPNHSEDGKSAPGAGSLPKLPGNLNPLGTQVETLRD